MTVEFLQQHWLAVCVLAVGVALAVGGWLRPAARRGFVAGALLVGLTGVGGLSGMQEPWPIGLFVTTAVLLAVLVAILASTGFWTSWLGVPVFLLMLFALGAALLAPLGDALAHAGRLLLSLEPLEPFWLVLLLLVPWVVWFSYRRLAALGSTRRVIAIGLRSLIVILVVFALAEMHARRTEDRLTVLFLWDRSLSVPAEYEGDVNKREERIKKFINDSVMKRGPAKQNDRIGVITFGKQPRLELPPHAVEQLKIRRFESPVDDTYTDIAAAIKLALASFPESSSKRLVLVSDGNENLGNAEEQARIAKQNGVQIDVIPIGGSRRNPNEVLVERVDAPSLIEKDSRISLRVLLRSFNPQIVVGKLQLYKISLEDRAADKKEGVQPAFETRPVSESVVKLRYGLNPFVFTQPGTKKDDAYVYEVKFVPMHVENAGGIKLQENVAGDRVENNRASVSVMARGQRSVLLVEPEVGNHALLANRLRAAKSSLTVVSIEPAKLPQNPAELAMVLSKFDCIILANVPAESITDNQQKVIRSVVYDQGVGLVMVGGNNSYGAGGWQNTEVEKALPVMSELKSMKIEGKSGLVLIMHASEIADGNAWQRKIAKLALEKLSPMDMVGQIHFDHTMGGHKWHIPFQEIKNNRNALLNLVDSMVPGDMPDVDPALIKAYNELTDPKHGLGTKHIIFISDGDHWTASRALCAKLRAAKITCTTVCITSHGADEIKKMAEVAFLITGTGYRAYHVKDPAQLPSIYIRESRLVSQAWMHEKEFQPRLLLAGGPTEGFQGELENLYGFNRTTKRSSPLVEVQIETPKIGEYKFPILATWQYGLGKSAAFMSDARTQPGGKTFWDRDWANAPIHAKFWEQTVDWALRAVETGKHLQVHTEQRDGKIRVVLEAKNSAGEPITDLEIASGLTSPSFKGAEARRKELRFEQRNSGVYEAELFADEVGAYFINLQAKWKEDGKDMSDGIRAGVSIPYSPEFAELESNPTLLDKLREITGGKTYFDDAAALSRAAELGEVFRGVPQSHHSLQPLWYWLVALAGMLLLFDVAVRRVAVEPAAVWARGVEWWDKMRGRQVATASAGAFLDRLKSRKAQVGETLEKEKATRRFEGTPASPTAVDAGATAMTEAPKPRTAPPPRPAERTQPETYAERLMRAKKRALEDRDKEK
jgi:uncharacterized membrane protein